MAGKELAFSGTLPTTFLGMLYGLRPQFCSCWRISPTWLDRYFWAFVQLGSHGIWQGGGGALKDALTELKPNKQERVKGIGKHTPAQTAQRFWIVLGTSWRNKAQIWLIFLIPTVRTCGAQQEYIQYLLPRSLQWLSFRLALHYCYLSEAEWRQWRDASKFQALPFCLWNHLTPLNIIFRRLN